MSASAASAAAQEPAANPAAEEIVACDGATIAATVSMPAVSAPSAVLVLSHGLYLESGCWSAASKQLTDAPSRKAARDDVAVLAYDHRGHGRSQAGSEPLTLELLARDMSAVICRAKVLAPGAAVILAGHSLGAMTALSMLAAGPVPDLPDALVLMGASAGCLTGGGLLRCLPAIASRHPGAFAKAQHLLRSASSPVLGKPAAAASSLPPLAAAQLLASLGAYDITSRLAALLDGLRVSLLVGGGDRITPPAHAQAIAQACPTASLEVLGGRGHNLPIDSPTEVAGALQRAVASLC